VRTDVRELGPALVTAMLSAGCGPRPQHDTAPTAAAPVTIERSPAIDVAAQPITPVTVTAPAEELAAPIADSVFPSRVAIIDPKASSGMVAFVAALPKRARYWLGPLAGNGGRDVLIYLPEGADPHAPLRLVFHFHGTHSEHIEPEAPGVPKTKWVGWNRLQQSTEAIDELQREGGTNVALVYPLSAGKRREPGKTGWYNKEYDRMWMAPSPPGFTDDFDVLWDETRVRLQHDFGVHRSKLPERAIAEGHSAGGIALLNIAVTGTEHVQEYLFLDASFQGWADGVFAALAHSEPRPLVSIVVTINGIADPFGKPDPWCTELEADELDEYTAWCEGMKTDMRDVPGVFVLRTRIAHGKQPRHFVGGLELPADRYSQ
jgi:hypothetical protein